jgi:hypothetical protein
MTEDSRHYHASVMADAIDGNEVIGEDAPAWTGGNG